MESRSTFVPQDSIQAGIGLITEDRHKAGLALNLASLKILPLLD